MTRRLEIILSAALAVGAGCNGSNSRMNAPTSRPTPAVQQSVPGADIVETFKHPPISSYDLVYPFKQKEGKIEELTNDLKRVQAEFENFKKRLEK